MIRMVFAASEIEKEAWQDSVETQTAKGHLPPSDSIVIVKLIMQICPNIYNSEFGENVF